MKQKIFIHHKCSLFAECLMMALNCEQRFDACILTSLLPNFRRLADDAVFIIDSNVLAQSQYSVIDDLRALSQRSKIVAIGEKCIPSAFRLKGINSFIHAGMELKDAVSLLRRLISEDIEFLFDHVKRPPAFENDLGLSSKELEVANMLIAGLKTKEIAETLCVIPSTVGNYKDRICEKLGVDRKFLLVRLCEMHSSIPS